MDEITLEILNLVKKKMIEQGAYDRAAYNQYIDETIDYFLIRGKLTDDDNLSLIKDNLLDIWEEFEADLSR